jgi:hypothetical protein
VKFIALLVSLTIFSGCASSSMKARKEQREKVSQTSRFYCDFVNGEVYPDVEIVLNLEMAKRCDSDKNFSISQYKTNSENVGMMYCCVMASAGRAQSAAAAVAAPKTEPKPAAKSETPSAAAEKTKDELD